MEKHIALYHKVIKELIEESFPSLKNVKLWICEEEGLKHTADTTQLICSSYDYRIRTNPRLRKVSISVLKGIFAHELCHVEWSKNTSIWKKIQQYLPMILNYEKCITAIERGTDIEALKKGYTKELLNYKIWRYKFKDANFHRLKNRYLNPDEIKEYIKNKKISTL